MPRQRGYSANRRDEGGVADSTSSAGGMHNAAKQQADNFLASMGGLGGGGAFPPPPPGRGGPGPPPPPPPGQQQQQQRFSYGGGAAGMGGGMGGGPMGGVGGGRMGGMGWPPPPPGGGGFFGAAPPGMMGGGGRGQQMPPMGMGQQMGGGSMGGGGMSGGSMGGGGGGPPGMMGMAMPPGGGGGGGGNFFGAGAMPPGGRGPPGGAPAGGAMPFPPPPPPPPSASASASQPPAGLVPPPPPAGGARSSKENRGDRAPESEADAAKRREKRKLEEKEREVQKAKREALEKERLRQIETIPMTSDIPGNGRRLEMGDYLCPFAFDGSLPALPSDPKLVDIAFDKASFVKFRYDSKAEAQAKYELLAEPDLGITIDLVDPQAYMPPAGARIAQEDAVLLSAHAFALATGEKRNATDSAKEMRKEVTFLRKTPLLSNNLYDAVHKHQKAPIERQHVVPQTKALANTNEGPQTLVQVVESIEKGFEEAAALSRQPEKITHPSHDTSIKAVEVLPVLPDVECWENAYVQATFDVDPSLAENGDVEASYGKSRVSRAVIKQFRNSSNKPFLAYLVPPEQDAGEEADEEPSDGLEMEWVRDYTAKLGADAGGSYFLVVRDDAAVYNAFEGSLKLTRSASMPKVERPSRVTLRRRAMDLDEVDATETKRLLLTSTTLQLTDKSGGGGDGEGGGGGGESSAAGEAAGSGEAAADDEEEDDDDPFGGAGGSDEEGGVDVKADEASGGGEDDEEEGGLMDDDDDDE